MKQLHSEDTEITVIDENWQHSMQYLGNNARISLQAPSNIVGGSLNDYEITNTEDIIGDGNYLF